MVSIPQTHFATPGEATGETWHHFKSNFSATKAAATRKRALCILFINKVIHKWLGLWSVCVRYRWGWWRWNTSSLPIFSYAPIGRREMLRGFCLYERGWEGEGGRGTLRSLWERQKQSVRLFEVIWSKPELHRLLLHRAGRKKTHRATVPWVGYLCGCMTAALVAAEEKKQMLGSVSVGISVSFF